MLLGDELRESVKQNNEESILEKISKTILFYEDKLKEAAKRGQTSFSLPSDDANEIAPLIYQHSKTALPFIVDKFGLNVSVLQGSTFIYGSTSTVKLLWDKPADIKNCDLSALR